MGLDVIAQRRSKLLVVRLGALAAIAGTFSGCGPALVSATPPVQTGSAAAPATIGATQRPTIAPTSIPAIASARPAPAATERVAPTEQISAVPTADLVTPTPVVLSVEERRQIFDEIWRTVKEHYLYSDFHGVDWDAVRDEYGARVEADQTRDEFYSTMVEMVARLNDQHSRFQPPAAAQEEDATMSNGAVTVGIGVMARARADGAFIQVVFPESPAARADLAPRDRIIAVDGRPYRPDDGDLLGAAGSSVRLTVVRPGAKPRDVVLTRQEVQNHIVPSYRRFPGDIGYVVIPTLWVNDMDEQVNGALTDLVAAGRLNGLILDVRANGGGWSYVLSGILGHFVRGQAGTFFSRQKIRQLEVPTPAGPDLRRVPLAVLVDNDTASYAEVLAAVLQRESGALVVGSRTAGNTETIYAYTLADGSRLWLAQEGFRLRDGTNLEGAGVQPDSTVDVDWTRYSEDDDPQLLEALRLLGAGPK